MAKQEALSQHALVDAIGKVVERTMLARPTLIYCRRLGSILKAPARRVRNADLGKTGEFQERLVPRLFIPFGVLTLVFGALLVFDGPWSFGDLWIVIGLAGWIAAWGVGFLVIRPQGEKMKEIVMQHGPRSPEAQRQARLLAAVSRVQLLSLFLMVADMVLKPTSDDPWTLVILGAILVAAAALGAWTMRKPLRDAEPAAESQ